MAPTREQILAAFAGWVAIVLNVLAGLLALAGVTASEASLAVKKVRQGGCPDSARQISTLLLPGAGGNACKGRLCGQAGGASLCSETKEAPRMDDTPPRQLSEAR
ncbi:hypothetical protein KBY57_00870 [Cyanobium sp. Aljojuca 7D2]|uniref:hypothetical protein n=1 Tax=Cyanobium sp. Aljojuca 7D2 TaxID=2823698 RepID=UPI0020CCB03B|nr:hypothetical protein [Cyanobium sp. Aljojuca 7D2]MCP9889608.1 hypothetical protein [Cyanobium sp. Aljojuca 7D2]